MPIKNEVKALCSSISKTPDSQTAFMQTKLNAKTILPFFSNMLKTQPISIAVIENESSVRKRPARKMAITDKQLRNSTLSVNLSAILDKSVEQHCIQKSRTKSVANRPPLFGISLIQEDMSSLVCKLIKQIQTLLCNVDVLPVVD